MAMETLEPVGWLFFSARTYVMTSVITWDYRPLI